MSGTRHGDIPVVVLCGGRGVYVDGSGVRRVKPLVEIAGEPLVVHLLRHYADHGFGRFILSAGYQRAELAAALARLPGATAGAGGAEIEARLADLPCRIEVVDSGEAASTGDRIRACEGRLGAAPIFAATYSDSLSTVDLGAMAAAHLAHGKIATLLAARVPTRFRILGMRPGETIVRGFATKPVIRNDFINGGFYFFRREVLGPDLLGAGRGIVLEETVLDALAARGELIAFPFEGPWRFYDAERDAVALGEMVGGR